MNVNRLLPNFETLLGPDAVVADPMTGAVILTPTTQEAVVAAVAKAHEERVPLYLRGGGTHPRVPTDQPVLILQTLGVNALIEHAKDDLTFTAEAGMTLERAASLLEGSGQCLPISAPWPERCTLGGALARAAEGPTKKGFGSVRDQLLGVSIVHGDGRLTKAGGRVVKNVTGYDLCRLYTGSLGALGVITQVTLRLRPKAERVLTLIRRCRDLDQAWHLGWELRNAHHDLFALHVAANGAVPRLGGADGVRLIITVRGGDPLVTALLGAVPADVVLESDPIPDLQTPFSAGTQRFLVDGVPGDAYAAAEETFRHVPEDTPMLLDVSSGALQFAFPSGWPLDREFEADLGQALKPFNVIVNLTEDPRFPDRRYEFFPSSVPGGLELMHAMTRALDPHGILNRGMVEFALSHEGPTDE